MKCVLCFESCSGVHTNDYFVSSPNGHVFHYSCVVDFVAGGSVSCPLCEEDLRFTKLSKVENDIPHGTSGKSLLPTHKSDMNSNHLVATHTNHGSTHRSGKSMISSIASFSAQPDFIFKIVILGNYNVGKSSLLQRYADDKFDPKLVNTIGCDLRAKAINIAGKNIRLNMWDTAGQEKHRAVVDMYLRNVDGVIFCFDITSRESFDGLQDWFQFADRIVPNDVHVHKLIVGTKKDLWDEREVETEEVQEVGDKWNAQCIYTSAKNATNVEGVFRSLSAHILEDRLPCSESLNQELQESQIEKAFHGSGIMLSDENLGDEARKSCC